MHEKISIVTDGPGLYEVTENVERVVAASGIENGMCVVFIQHTSASLLIQENADPSAKHDLEQWLQRLVKEGDPLYTHTSEGPDDMPSHIKSALTNSNLSIPVINGHLALGTWQGIYVWEHRRASQRRNLIVSVN